MVLRLAGFLQAVAGVTPELCTFLAARIDDGWLPLVPDGPYGAAGEIGPLAHLFQTLIGEGWVEEGGTPVPAGEALARLGLEPYDPMPKEGVALLNGSPFATALGIRLAERAAGLVATATDGRRARDRRHRRRSEGYLAAPGHLGRRSLRDAGAGATVGITRRRGCLG